MNYTCPVCGYAKLENPPEDYVICPSCGTEFGYDDVTRSYEQLRNAWISEGPSWFFGQKPYLWNPWTQLAQAGLAYAFPFTAEVHLSQSFVAYERMSATENPEILVRFQ